MKNVVINSLALACLSGSMIELADIPAQAQQAGGTQIQQQSQKLDVGSLIAGVHGSASSISITPPSGNFVYLTSIHLEDCATNTVAVAIPTSVISTGFSTSGSPSFEVQSGTTSGLCSESNIVWPTGLRSQQAGGTVTLVLPTFAASQLLNLEATYYVSP